MSIQGEILRINTEITVQEDLMNSIINALQGKSVSGGGSSIEMEEGIYTPTEDASNPLIYFSNHHEKMPSFIFAKITDDSGEAFVPYLITYFEFINYFGLTGSKINRSSAVSSSYYGYSHIYYVDSSGVSSTSGGIYQSRETDLQSYATNEYFKLYSTGSSKYIANRSYKWKALWL